LEKNQFYKNVFVILVLQFKTREFQFIYLIWPTKNLIIYRNPGYCNFGCDKWRSYEVL